VEDRSYVPGSQEDFDRLYRDSYSSIVATLMAVLGYNLAAAEDCAQETFVLAFRSWARWRPDAPAGAWLHRIALNVASSHRRRERLRDIGEVLRRLGRPGLGPDPAELATGEVSAALRRMPLRDAAIVVLRHHHGYTNREIARALGVAESTLSSRLRKAMERLRAELKPGVPAVVTEADSGVLERGAETL
jgi:RNA polymerase sigma-70 factor (ECF subfamily)